MEITLPRLEEWQQEVYDAVTEGEQSIYVVKSKRQVGKSVLAIILMIYFCFTKKCTSVIVEPTLNQSRRVFKQIVELLADTGLIKNANATLLNIDFVNGSDILFKSAEQDDALRGFTVSGLLVIDEGAFIKDSIFDILFPTVDAHDAPILIISTPLFEDGKFYDLYIEGLQGEGILSFDWARYDTSVFLSAEKLEMYRRTLEPNKFRSEYLGEFITEGSFIFGNVKGRIGQPEDKVPIYAGIDFGTGGGDYTVITMLNRKGECLDAIGWKDKSPTEQVDLLSKIINSTPTLTKVNLEINSIGKVYFDYLKKAVKKQDILKQFNTDNSSKRRIIEQLIKAFQTEEILIPNDEEMIIQLQHYALDKTQGGKITYNAQSGYHDDYVMSLAMAYDLVSSKSGNYTVSFTKKRKRLFLKDIYNQK